MTKRKVKTYKTGDWMRQEQQKGKGMNKNYVKRLIESPLPLLAEDERIYLKVPYMNRSFAKYCHCGFDTKRKLWFTGAYNFNLRGLVRMYEVDESTSDNARSLLGIALDTSDRDELMTRIQKYYDDRKAEEE